MSRAGKEQRLWRKIDPARLARITYPLMVSLMMASAISLHLLQAAPTSSMASLRMIAAILLVVLLCGLIYVLRNIRSLRVEVAGSERVGKRGRDRTLIFLACAVTFVLVCLLLFFVARA